MTHSSLPPLDALRAFEAAARNGSFSAAAESLNRTHGAVSRQIAKLEHWVGRPLFERRARGVMLTPEGRRLYASTEEAFALIADGADRWLRARGSAIVRITALPSVSGLWLIPRLRALELGPPNLRIELVVEDRFADLDGEGIDLALRCGRGAVPGRVSVKLFEELCFPIASPALATEIGKGAPERLFRYPLIHDSDASGWRTWLAAHGLDYRIRPQDRRFEDYSLVLDAAAHGLGIALARPPLAESSLKSRRVVAVDPRTAPNPYVYWLDRPPGEPRTAAAEAASRLMTEAGLDRETVERFLASQ